MMGQASPLPVFESPPVIETVLGVEFVPLSGWDVPAMGLYWGEIKDQFPVSAVRHTLASRQEEFDQRSTFGREASLLLSQRPDSRLWFMDEEQTRLIQTQRDRFVQNWKKADKNASEYPRYQVLIDEFQRRWEHLLDFMKRHEIGTPEVRQCEVT